MPLPVIADSTLLHGVSFASVRKVFNTSLDKLTNRARNQQADDNHDDKECRWPSDIRRDCCIVIDDLALDSLLKAPDFIPGQIPNLAQEP